MGTCGKCIKHIATALPLTQDLQYNGAEGVELAVKILLREFRITMALCGYGIAKSKHWQGKD